MARTDSPFDLARLEQCADIASLVYLPEVVSTNSHALGLVATDNMACPALVLAEMQTAGRGRGGNRWFSQEGALTFSLVVEYELPPSERAQVALLAGLAVCEALREQHPTGIFQLKWPNDVYLHGKKACGILVEGSGPRYLIIGIGINVNNSLADLPAEVQARAISLADAAGHTFDITTVLLSVVRHLTAILAVHKEQRHSFAAAFASYCLLTGKIVTVRAGAEMIVGRCLGIAADGALQLQTESGTRAILSGEVVSFE